MKRTFLYFLFAAIAIVFTACSDDDDPVNPITNLELPASSADAPLMTSTEIEIKGQGFTENSEIWFEDISGNKVKAEIKSVNENGITVVTPEEAGEYAIILVYNNNSFTLGTIYLTAPVKKRIKSNTDYSTGNVETTYTYEGNRLVKIVDADPYGGMEKVFGYDNDGNLVSTTVTALYSWSPDPIFVEKYTYEITEKTANGMVITAKFYSGDENTLVQTQVLHINADELIDYVTEGPGKQEYTYDSNGNWIKRVSTNENSGNVQETRYTYDSNHSMYKYIAQPAKWWWVHYSPGLSFNPDGNNATQFELYNNGVNSFTFNYEYDYDEDGYPAKMYSVTNGNRNTIREITYETIE
jgi:hypothetical protein